MTSIPETIKMFNQFDEIKIRYINLAKGNKSKYKNDTVVLHLDIHFPSFFNLFSISVTE